MWKASNNKSFKVDSLIMRLAHYFQVARKSLHKYISNFWRFMHKILCENSWPTALHDGALPLHMFSSSNVHFPGPYFLHVSLISGLLQTRECVFVREKWQKHVYL